MKSHILCLGFITFITTSAPAEEMHVINNTNHSLDINFTLPEQTVALIQLKKLEVLFSAILNDSAEEIRAAVHAGADVNQEKDGKSPLLLAILLKRHNAVETLLQLGAKPDDICGQQATKTQDLKSLLLLFRYGYHNLNIKEVESVISNSVSHYQKEAIDFIRELVNHKYDINIFWRPAILLAANNPSVGQEIIRFLISREANLNHMINGKTPLHLAVWFGNTHVVEILMEAGADINKKIEHPGTPPRSLLSYAIERCGNNPSRREVIEFLVKHGANL